MTNEEFEPIRIRIMKEAYDLSDKDDTEGFNAIKVMCGDIQNFLQRTWVGLTDEEVLLIYRDQSNQDFQMRLDPFKLCAAIEAKLKEKNNGND